MNYLDAKVLKAAIEARQRLLDGACSDEARENLKAAIDQLIEVIERKPPVARPPRPHGVDSYYSWPWPKDSP